MPRNKRSVVLLHNKLLRTLVLAIGVSVALAGYFALSIYVLPQSYQKSSVPRKPEPVVTDVNMPASVILGTSFTITVTGVNNGEEADVQIVSVGFPNLTSTTNVKVLNHNFRQMPIVVGKGGKVGSEYVGTAKTVDAQYIIVEAMSRPWPSGNSYSLSLQVIPETEGPFVVLIKSIGFPSWNGAHWPQDGLVDPQKEFVKGYHIEVTNA
jgi:hypothetical protein